MNRNDRDQTGGMVILNFDAQGNTGVTDTQTTRRRQRGRRAQGPQSELAALARISPQLARMQRQEQLRREGRTLHRMRLQIRPWLIAAAVYAGTSVLWLVDLAGASALDVASVAASAGVLAMGATWLVARSKLPRRWRSRIWAALAAGTAWSTYAAWTGPSWLALLLLVLTTLLVSARWWRYHRPGYPTQRPGPEMEEVEEQLEVPQLWARYVAANGYPLPGSYLSAPNEKRTSESHVISYRVSLARGKQTLDDAVGATTKVASALGVQPKKVIFEELDGDQDPATIQLHIVHRSPADDPRFDGPRYRDGLLEIGPYVDGDGEAVYRLYTPGDEPHGGSMWSGAIIAATSYGKSRMLENLAVSAMSATNTVLWFVDPQDGSSSPALMRNCDWFANKERAKEMKAAFTRIAEWRGKENAVNGWTGFDPTPERPGIWMIIDEAHEIVDKELETLARKIRKLGMAITLVSQYSGLETFAGSDVLRGSVMAGNTIAMYTSSNVSGQLMAGLEVDPKNLPKVPGFGYTQRVGSTGRTAPFRNRLISDPAAWMAAQPRAQLDALATNAAGPAYLNRHDTAADAVTALRSDVEAMRAGTYTPSKKSPANGPARAVPSPAPSTGEFQVPEFPAAPNLQLVSDQGQASEKTRDGAGDKQTARSTVVAALVAAPGRELKFAELLDHVHRLHPDRDYSETAVRNALAELQADGDAAKVGHGRYQLTETSSTSRPDGSGGEGRP